MKMNFGSIEKQLLTFCLVIVGAYGIRFNLEPNTHKCFKDEVQPHQLIVLEVEASYAQAQQLDYVVSVLNAPESMKMIIIL